ncbi:MAG: macro domain-containing protein [Bacilli bacterium]|nr:macro domain-containing protein [Bacilli bacterium]
MSSFKIIHGSCVLQDVDAVVNAANKYLASGGGVCGEIFRRAGYEKLNLACSKIKTPLDDGDAVITEAFNITNAKYIIHAVGPDFNNSSAKLDDLFRAYYNSLVVLKDNNLHSISFPLISSGIYGGNLDNPAIVSAEECLKAYNEFNLKYEYDINVILCAYSIDEFNRIKSIISD